MFPILIGAGSASDQARLEVNAANLNAVFVSLSSCCEDEAMLAGIDYALPPVPTRVLAIGDKGSSQLL